MFTWRGQWIGAAGWQTGALGCAPRDRWIGWRREEQFRRLPGTTRGLLFLVVAGCCRALPRLRCRGWCGGDREAAVACCGVVCLADEVQRHHVQGGEPGGRWQELCARQRAPTGTGRRRIFTCFRCVVTSAAGPFVAGAVLVWRIQFIDLTRLCGREAAAKTGFRDNRPFRDRILSRPPRHRQGDPGAAPSSRHRGANGPTSTGNRPFSASIATACATTR